MAALTRRMPGRPAKPKSKPVKVVTRNRAAQDATLIRALKRQVAALKMDVLWLRSELNRLSSRRR